MYSPIASSERTPARRSASSSENGWAIPGGGIGVPGCSMAAVASEAGVALKTVYLAFDRRSDPLAVARRYRPTSTTQAGLNPSTG